MTSPAINPGADCLGRLNAVLTGSSRFYHVPDFEGSLSLKSVVRGSATWETEGRRFVVRENSWLILNDRQRYTLTIARRQPTTTFCVFFQRGFVEDIWRARVTHSEQLLDEPHSDQRRHGVTFLQRLGDDEELRREIRFFRTALLSGCLSPGATEDAFLRVASKLVCSEEAVLARASNMSALRASTKREVCKRVLRGHDLLLSCFDRKLFLADLARAACMSPYHFHRSFRELFGATPHAVLTKHRLQHAAERLRASDDSVTAISNQCGFESLPSFSSLFRRHFAQSPSQFRRRARPN